MNGMFIPEKIDLMCQPVTPVSVKVYGKKGDEVGENSYFQMLQGNFRNQPLVRKKSDTEAQNIFDRIGYSGTYARNTVDERRSVVLFIDAVYFFNDN